MPHGEGPQWQPLVRIKCRAAAQWGEDGMILDTGESSSLCSFPRRLNEEPRQRCADVGCRGSIRRSGERETCPELDLLLVCQQVFPERILGSFWAASKTKIIII